MTPALRLGLGGIVWSGLAYGVLALRLVPGDYSHPFCGPWGCLPPLQALAAMHGFWALVIAPLALLAIRSLSTTVLRSLGRALVVLGIVGLLGILGWTAGSLVHLGSTGLPDYLPQRLLAAVVTTSDVPALQMLAAGIAFAIVARRRAAAPAGDASPLTPDSSDELIDAAGPLANTTSGSARGDGRPGVSGGLSASERVEYRSCCDPGTSSMARAPAPRAAGTAGASSRLPR